MKKNRLTLFILAGLILGIIVGVIFNLHWSDSEFAQTYFVNGLFYLLGNLFKRLVSMMVVPLVFVSLVLGAATVGDIKKLGRIGGKTLIFYLATTAVAITIALLFANLTNPGLGFELGELSEITAPEKVSLVDTIVNIVPNNPVEAMNNGSMLQIIFFALAIGTSMTVVGEKAKPVYDLFVSLNEITLKLIVILMKFAPIGVFGLIAMTFSNLGFDAIQNILAYILTVGAALLIHCLITYPTLLVAFAKLNPIQFFKNWAPAMLVAFSTSSSNATLPVSIETATERLGIDEKITTFTLPLGATINMDGTSIMQGVATVFLAQAYGIDLTFNQYILIILTATLASIGTAGVPSVGTIMLAMVLQQVGIDIAGISIILAVDRIVDMLRTTVNITGDAVCSSIIAKSEDAIDLTIFEQENVAN